MRWIVCFCESKNYGLWKLFTFWRKGFGHVFAVRYDAYNKVWLMAECASEKINIDVMTDTEADELFCNMMELCTCVEVTDKRLKTQLPRWLYCVSFVKHLIGCNKWWIFTPYQLYCELLKNDCAIMFEETKGA